MSTAAPPREDRQISQRVRATAKSLETYIRTRGFKPGDRFIQPQEAAEILGESVTTVQRAMAFLADKNLLERRPKAGTFIRDLGSAPTAPYCIHFLLPESAIDQGTQGGYWNLVRGMREVMPEIAVQFDFLASRTVDAARYFVNRASAAGSLLGVVLGLPTRELRMHFNNGAIPTVVAGGVESYLDRLCWYDWDQTQTGQLHAGYLLDRGHRRIATVMRDVWAMGEHHLHDGVSEVLASAGLAVDALRVRSAPNDKAAINEVGHELLGGDEPSTGIICRTEFQADCIAEAARSLGMWERVDVVVCNTSGLGNHSKYTHVVSEISDLEQGKIVGRMFKSMANGETPEPRGARIGVKLQIVAR